MAAAIERLFDKSWRVTWQFRGNVHQFEEETISPPLVSVSVEHLLSRQQKRIFQPGLEASTLK